MKRRLGSVLLALCLCLSLAPAAWAYSDKTYSQSTTLPVQMGFEYDNVVVKAGVTVTFRDLGRDPQTLWIHESLTVEPGGKLVGGSIAFLKGATYSGMDFYYKVMGEEVLLDPADLATLIADDPESRQIFNWDAATGHYVRTGGEFNADPFFDTRAVEDVTFSVTTDLRGRQTAHWGAAVIKAGATVTLDDRFGSKHIRKSLTVEPGGVLKGGQLEIFCGATVTGLPLYYRAEGEVRQVPDSDLTPMWPRDADPENRASFVYDAASGRYILQNEFENDPFTTPPPTPGGQVQPVPDQDRELAIARGLKSLGLFNGVVENAVTADDFALRKAPSRTEAVVLLIRLLGRDTEAKNYPKNYAHDDVADWARGYITYAFDAGITNGVGGGVFGEGTATVQQFLTFVLRAMGYEDESRGGADFSYKNPEVLAERLGIVLGPGDKENFTRGTCVKILEAALRNSMKDGSRLYEKLAAAGVFTEEQYHAAMGGV